MALMRWPATHRNDPTTLHYTTSLVNMTEKLGGVKKVSILNGVKLVFCRRELIDSAFLTLQWLKVATVRGEVARRSLVRHVLEEA